MLGKLEGTQGSYSTQLRNN